MKGEGKMKKKIALCLCIVVFVLSLTGCGKKATYSYGSRKIYVNLAKEQKTITTTNVRFYDFLNNRNVQIADDTYTLISYGSYEVWFTDDDGNDYAAHSSAAFNDLPKSFKLYTNYSETTWDTYSK